MLRYRVPYIVQVLFLMSILNDLEPTIKSLFLFEVYQKMMSQLLDNLHYIHHFQNYIHFQIFSIFLLGYHRFGCQ